MDDPRADLDAYAGTYLQEAVVAEGATRNVPAFSRFLRVAALANGTIVNFTNVANDAQVARTTVKRKPLASSKFYLFDVGVAGRLQGRQYRPGTPEFGVALETLVLHELTSYRDYVSGEPLAYWRSTSGFEVDFLIGDHTAIEVKATATVSNADLKGLRAFAEEGRVKHHVLVCLESRPRQVGEVLVLPIAEFLRSLWDGQFAARGPADRPRARVTAWGPRAACTTGTTSTSVPSK